MRSTMLSIALGIVLACGLSKPAFAAEDGAKALPVLLIKGEVVSVDTNDPAGALLKVKDRYGFETPIYVTPEAKIMQGDTPAQIASLTSGATVEVEYNFDVNTAKRHAVSVKLAAPTQAAAASVPAAAAVPAAAMTPPGIMSIPAATAPAAPSAPADSSTQAAPAAMPAPAAAPAQAPSSQPAAAPAKQ